MIKKILLRWIAYALCIFGLINWFCTHLGYPIFENSLIWIVPGLIGGTMILPVKAFSLGKESSEEETSN